jgi:hypothetical protein
MGISDKISEIEAEMARTQKNKATEHHLGALKAKLGTIGHSYYLLSMSHCALAFQS